MPFAKDPNDPVNQDAIIFGTYNAMPGPELRELLRKAQGGDRTAMAKFELWAKANVGTPQYNALKALSSPKSQLNRPDPEAFTPVRAGFARPYLKNPWEMGEEGDEVQAGLAAGSLSNKGTRFSAIAGFAEGLLPQQNDFTEALASGAHDMAASYEENANIARGKGYGKPGSSSTGQGVAQFIEAVGEEADPLEIILDFNPVGNAAYSAAMGGLSTYDRTGEVDRSLGAAAVGGATGYGQGKLLTSGMGKLAKAGSLAGLGFGAGEAGAGVDAALTEGGDPLEAMGAAIPGSLGTGAFMGLLGGLAGKPGEKKAKPGAKPTPTGQMSAEATHAKERVIDAAAKIFKETNDPAQVTAYISDQLLELRFSAPDDALAMKLYPDSDRMKIFQAAKKLAYPANGVADQSESVQVQERAARELKAQNALVSEEVKAAKLEAKLQEAALPAEQQDVVAPEAAKRAQEILGSGKLPKEQAEAVTGALRNPASKKSAAVINEVVEADVVAPAPPPAQPEVIPEASPVAEESSVPAEAPAEMAPPEPQAAPEAPPMEEPTPPQAEPTPPPVEPPEDVLAVPPEKVREEARPAIEEAAFKAARIYRGSPSTGRPAKAKTTPSQPVGRVKKLGQAWDAQGTEARTELLMQTDLSHLYRADDNSITEKFVVDEVLPALAAIGWDKIPAPVRQAIIRQAEARNPDRGLDVEPTPDEAEALLFEPTTTANKGGADEQFGGTEMEPMLEADDDPDDVDPLFEDENELDREASKILAAAGIFPDAERMADLPNQDVRTSQLSELDKFKKELPREEDESPVEYAARMAKTVNEMASNWADLRSELNDLEAGRAITDIGGETPPKGTRPDTWNRPRGKNAAKRATNNRVNELRELLYGRWASEGEVEKLVQEGLAVDFKSYLSKAAVSKRRLTPAEMEKVGASGRGDMKIFTYSPNQPGPRKYWLLGKQQIIAEMFGEMTGDSHGVTEGLAGVGDGDPAKVQPDMALLIQDIAAVDANLLDIVIGPIGGEVTRDNLAKFIGLDIASGIGVRRSRELKERMRNEAEAAVRSKAQASEAAAPPPAGGREVPTGQEGAVPSVPGGVDVGSDGGADAGGGPGGAQIEAYLQDLQRRKEERAANLPQRPQGDEGGFGDSEAFAGSKEEAEALADRYGYLERGVDYARAAGALFDKLANTVRGLKIIDEHQSIFTSDWKRKETWKTTAALPEGEATAERFANAALTLFGIDRVAQDGMYLGAKSKPEAAERIAKELGERSKKIVYANKASGVLDDGGRYDGDIGGLMRFVDVVTSLRNGTPDSIRAAEVLLAHGVSEYAGRVRDGLMSRAYHVGLLANSPHTDLLSAVTAWSLPTEIAPAPPAKLLQENLRAAAVLRKELEGLLSPKGKDKEADRLAKARGLWKDMRSGKALGKADRISPDSLIYAEVYHHMVVLDDLMNSIRPFVAKVSFGEMGEGKPRRSQADDGPVRWNENELPDTDRLISWLSDFVTTPYGGIGNWRDRAAKDGFDLATTETKGEFTGSFQPSLRRSGLPSAVENPAMPSRQPRGLARRLAGPPATEEQLRRWTASVGNLEPAGVSMLSAEPVQEGLGEPLDREREGAEYAGHNREVDPLHDKRTFEQQFKPHKVKVTVRPSSDPAVKALSSSILKDRGKFMGNLLVREGEAPTFPVTEAEATGFAIGVALGYVPKSSQSRLLRALAKTGNPAYFNRADPMGAALFRVLDGSPKVEEGMTSVDLFRVQNLLTRGVADPADFGYATALRLQMDKTGKIVAKDTRPIGVLRRTMEIQEVRRSEARRGEFEAETLPQSAVNDLYARVAEIRNEAMEPPPQRKPDGGRC